MIGIWLRTPHLQEYWQIKNWRGGGIGAFLPSCLPQKGGFFVNQPLTFTGLKKEPLESTSEGSLRVGALLKSEIHGGFVFLVMEFIEGQQLTKIMQSSGAMAPEDLLQIAHRMGLGLAAAHAQNAFHRDISENAQTVVGGDFK